MTKEQTLMKLKESKDRALSGVEKCRLSIEEAYKKAVQEVMKVSTQETKTSGQGTTEGGVK